MTMRDDWILDVIANLGRALDAALATAEDLYQKFVPEQQRSRAEYLYKTYVPEMMSRHWSPTRTPDVDVIDLGIEIHLVADLPGVKKGDINIDLTPDIVDITAEPQAEMEHEQPYARRERGYAYKRRTYLPASVIPEKAKARFNNGVLELTMPKKEPVEKVKAVKVTIKDTGG
ncbi:MAG: Hsp20/alpha crystallin family protein [Euryarchaeota archaeon]|nr:Hsp20/alpha crystallin family protein [Euryarchaeota archaeon]